MFFLMFVKYLLSENEIESSNVTSSGLLFSNPQDHSATVLELLVTRMPHLNPYLSCVGQVILESLHIKEFENSMYIREETGQEGIKVVSKQFTQNIYGTGRPKEREVLNLCEKYLRLRYEVKNHRLCDLYIHKICCDIALIALTDPSFLAGLSSTYMVHQLEAELDQLRQIINQYFQCSLTDLLNEAENGFTSGTLSVAKEAHTECAYCGSQTNVLIEGVSGMLSPAIGNYRAVISTPVEIERNGNAGIVVNENCYEIIIDDTSISNKNICTYKHLVEIIEKVPNTVLGHPYFGPEPVLFIGYKESERHLFS